MSYVMHQQTSEELIAALRERCQDLAAQLAEARKPSARMLPRAAQVWYSQVALASFFGRSTKTVIGWIVAGEMGNEWFRDGKDYLVSAAGYEAFVQRRCAGRFFGISSDAGRRARSMRRNARGQLARADEARQEVAA